MNRIRFETHHVQRVPVRVSPEAQAIIDKSNHQGRLLPQALAEHFGALGDITEITIELADKLDHFPTTPHITEQLFLITLKHMYTAIEDHTFYINVHDLHVRDDNRNVSFRSMSLAAELRRLYPYKTGLAVQNDKDSGVEVWRQDLLNQ